MQVEGQHEQSLLCSMATGARVSNVGIIALFLRGNTVRTFVKTKTLRSQTSEPNREDDVIDVEVIRSEDIGEKNDISGRSLR